MLIMPQDPSELKTKKPPEENPQGVNNNYNKLKKKFADRTFQLVSQNFGVVGKHTSKITRRAADKPAQLIKITSRGAAIHPQLINGKDIT